MSITRTLEQAQFLSDCSLFVWVLLFGVKESLIRFSESSIR
ncbi:hypothetical protein HSIEG1_3617 [Enterococcus sp. HSIEG1]|nr:hypothetical protein HSIEG1_3617 [Enterococcus sp. HSIEG1]OJG50958.1 hypothetical protein RV03_GL001239 [Enterococcus gallinarum]